MKGRGTVFIHVPRGHTSTILVTGGGDTPLIVTQAGRTSGLQEGDEVVGVDGASTTLWSSKLLHQTLRQASDVILEVIREMGDSVASAVVRQEGATIQTVSKTVHETDGLRVVGARVLSESGKVESSVEFPMITPPSSEPLATSTYSCNQSMAHSVTPETQEHSVSTLERSHMEASKESAVRMESVMEGVSQSSQSIKSCSQSSQSFQSSSQSSQSIQSASQLSQSIQSASQSSQSIQSASQSSQSIQRISQSSQSVQGVSQSQSIEGVVHSQAMEGVSQSQAIEGVSQSQSITEAPAEVPAVSQSQPEPQTVDENANSIQEQQETLVEQPAAEPEPIKEPEPIVEPVKEPEPVVEPEPIKEPEPIVEPVKEPEPVIEPVKEPEPVVEPEPIKEPEPVKEPVQEPEPIIEPVQEPEPVIESEPVVEAVAEPEPIIATAPEPAAPPDPEPVIKEAPVEPPPVVVEVEEISQENIKTQLQEIISEIEQEVVSEQQEEEEEEVQIQAGHEVVKEVVKDEGDQPVEVEEGEEVEYYDEDGVLHHTWKPKGKYEVPKTTVTYEDVVPISVPEVQFTEVEPKPEPPKPQPQPQPQPQLQQVVAPQNLQGMTNGGFSPGALSPIEIPEGIPLLARILPKVDHGEEGDKKISLERLFTPATDSGDMTPLKSTSKKAYASSSFYRPDHPTIDDQVELAQRISFSLVDENNKMSRGQSMYMKRKKRSMRWIHQGGEGEEDYSGPGSGTEGVEDEVTPRAPTSRRPVSMPPLHDTEGKKPAMKLLMNPKGVQDFHAVQEHYQTLMNAAPPSPEVGKIVTEVQSPTGKGAELFAKRKKRMDKFIVDETTVQKAQQQTTTMTQQSFSSSSNFSSSSTGTSSYSTKKQAELERDRQQEQILASLRKPVTNGKPELADTVCERADAKAAGAPWLEMPKPVPLAAPQFSAPPPLASGTGAIYTAEVKVVQRASLPPTPVIDLPQHSLLELMTDDKDDKRRSMSFNLAAKGWGTYNKFYTPVTFAT
ncbi:titin-like isoform X2 [Homarus americanus]|uniref:titin-like isoform X2 n=1 Tax=Homarus americanus TaxID=6706 RepID=UPI001C47FCFE|nr:titin-like isoform X2 [Homarus americanus]